MRQVSDNVGTAVGRDDDCASVNWHAIQLGVPAQQDYREFPLSLSGFTRRSRNYGFLKYHSDSERIPEHAIAEEFSKEHLRVTFQNAFMTETSDIDGIFWGEQHTYPIEVKEKTAATDKKMGEFFGLDVGPFVKLAFYAAKRGNLHSLFVVREINNQEERCLLNWWGITFEHMAQFASWVPVSGGRSMAGASSSVIKIPKSEFMPLSLEYLSEL